MNTFSNLQIHKGLCFQGNFILWDDKAPADRYCQHFLYPEGEIDSLFKQKKKDYQAVIKKLIDNQPTVSGQDIMNEVFPEIQADIFVSHSHADVKLAKDLAYYLSTQCKCKVFIDEYAWGNADEILKYMNMSAKTKDGYYSYEGCNRNAAAAYMILANAIAAMLHKCKLFIFVESEHSIRGNAKNETASPWLFYELQLFNKIVENELAIAQRLGIRIPAWINLRIQPQASLEGLDISYPVPKKFLLESNKRLIYDWSYSQYLKTPEGLYAYHTLPVNKEKANANQ